MNKKKWLILLAIVLGVAVIAGVVIAIAVSSASAKAYADFEYEVREDGVVITGYTGEETSVEIPRKIKGDLVVGIGKRAFASMSTLSSVTLPEGLVYIEEGAFYNCGLYNVYFPSSLRVVGDNAFAFCQLLTGATLPQGLTTIGENAFANCVAMGLGRVVIPDSVTSIGASAFYLTAMEKLNDAVEFVIVGDGVMIDYNGEGGKVTLPSTVKHLSSAFRGNDNVTEVVIPDSVQVIGDKAFSSCETLEKVTIGSGVKTIEEGAFLSCTKLTEVVLPEGVETLGGSAFYKCTGLETVTLPKSLLTIGGNAFSGCTALELVRFGGKSADWGKITIGSGNELLSGADFKFGA